MDDSGESLTGRKFEEGYSEMDLVDAAFVYKTELRYPRGCREARKRAIRKKASMFVVRDGVLFFKKKKKGGRVSS